MMRFEARDLKPYSEPINVHELQEGTIYFALGFLDREMLIPTLEPVVYIGKDLEDGEGNRDQFYFQDAESYRKGIRYPTGPGDQEAAVYSGSEPGHILTTNMHWIACWHVHYADGRASRNEHSIVADLSDNGAMLGIGCCGLDRTRPSDRDLCSRFLGSAS